MAQKKSDLARWKTIFRAVSMVIMARSKNPNPRCFISCSENGPYFGVGGSRRRSFYPSSGMEWSRWIDGMQCSGVQWNGVDGMQCSGVEWNGCILNPFGHLGSIFGNFF